MDPFERAEEENAMGYQRWYMEHMFVIAPAGAYVAQWLQSFREFPPRQKPGSFNLDRVMEAVTAGSAGNDRQPQHGNDDRNTNRWIIRVPTFIVVLFYSSQHRCRSNRSGSVRPTRA